MGPLLAALLIASGTTPPNERAAFVTTLGRDTVVIESFTRTANRVEGDIMVRVPGTVLCHYTAEFGADGNVTHTLLEVKPLAAPDVKTARLAMDFQPGSFHYTFDLEGKPQQTGMAVFAKGGYPFYMTGFGSSYGLYSSLGLYEMFLPHVSSKANDTTAVSGIDMGSGKVGPRQFIRRSPTQIDVDYFGGFAWTHLTVDADGHITAADASETTEKTQTSRVDFLDVERLAKTFAAADRSGHSIGAASPDKVVKGSIGGQPVTVMFGSPKKRGRDILGNVVRYDHVWRTGANAATTITFPKDVSVGGAAVPAGTYSLWTIPAQSGSVSLIINRQHGQWGTDYDQAQDLVRVPMQAATATPPREDFAIDVTGSGNAGELRISWDTFVWTAPIAMK